MNVFSVLRSVVGKLTLDGLTVTSLAPSTVEVSVTVAPGSVLGFIVQQVAVPRR